MVKQRFFLVRNLLFLQLYNGENRDNGQNRAGRLSGRRRTETRMSKVGASDSKNTLYCSFCGKSQHEVRKLIAGPTVFICDECVELCMDIIREENKSSLVKSRDGIPTPKEICKVLDD